MAVKRRLWPTCTYYTRKTRAELSGSHSENHGCKTLSLAYSLIFLNGLSSQKPIYKTPARGWGHKVKPFRGAIVVITSNFLYIRLGKGKETIRNHRNMIEACSQLFNNCRIAWKLNDKRGLRSGPNSAHGANLLGGDRTPPHETKARNKQHQSCAVIWWRKCSP